MSKFKKIVMEQKGGSLVYVLIVISIIGMLSTLAILKLKNIHDSVGYQQMNAKCYYLAKEVAEISKQALIDTNTKKTVKFTDISEKSKTITHKKNGEDVGTTKLKLVEQKIDEETYLVVYMKTSIDDFVNPKEKNGGKYTMYYEFRINEDNPYIQVFDIITEDKTI